MQVRVRVERNVQVVAVSDLVSRRPSTTLLPILVKAGGAILLLRLDDSLEDNVQNVKYFLLLT